MTSKGLYYPERTYPLLSISSSKQLAFLDVAFLLDTPSPENPGHILQYGTNYISQMIVAAGFVLLKLLSSFFASEVDFERGRQLFHKTIQAIRGMSVTNNDLSWRLAELMVQMWNGVRVDTRSQMGGLGEMDGSLQLKVRCRHSMSLVFDSIWRWREEFQAQGRGSLEAAMKNPTNPDSAVESRASSTQLDNTLMASTQTLHGGMQNQMHQNLPGLGGTVTPGISNPYGETNYEVFDPLNWMLDGLVDFPYSYAAVQGLEAQGMS